KEKHAASWALGLLASSAIKEHEKILNDLRALACPKMTAEASTFFLEEAVHSEAYQRFLDEAAKKLNLTTTELSTFLPKYKKTSFSGRIYALEAKLGGNAIWWAVAATEEESIRLFQKLLPNKENTDTLFFELNRLHFLEESRHSSFSYQMIRHRNAGKTLKKWSFAVSRVLQTIWLFQELNGFRKVKNFRDRHPLLEEMALLSEKIDRMSWRQKFKLIFRENFYTRMMSTPERHPRLRRALEIEKMVILRLPGAV
ncbi:MAG: diiron oxygenase, partial [Bacteriovoracaceae bacterium]